MSQHIPLDKLRYEHPSPETIRPYLEGPLVVGKLYDETTVEPTTTFGIPLDRQRRHIAHIAASGTGKTVTAQHACYHNAKATNGVDVIIDPKGGFADGFLPQVYHDQRDLESITYIKAATELPRLPLFDLRPYLEAEIGIARSRIIDIVIKAGIEVLKTAAISDSGFESAGQSIELLKTLLVGLFRSGANAVAVTTLLDVLDDVEAGTLTLEIDDPAFTSLLKSTTGGDKRTRQAIVGGARRRLAPLIRDPLFAEAFGSVPEDPTDQFNLVKALNQDEVIIIETAGLNATQREQLIRLIAGRFFIAGRLRQLQSKSNHPLANLYLDEAHVLGNSQILLDLLSEARAFDISLYLMSQELAQFGEEAQSHIETNIGTVLTAQSDRLMGQAVAQGPYSKRKSQHLVGKIPTGDWLVRIRPARGCPVPDPFIISAGSLAETHPESQQYADLPSAERQACQEAIKECHERSRASGNVITAVNKETAYESESECKLGLSHTLWLSSVSLPSGVNYDRTQNAIICEGCGESFFPQFDRLCTAIKHCEDIDLSSVEIPITDIGMDSVDPKRVQMCPLSLREVMYLRLIERAQRRAIDPRAWDVREETMYPLRQTLGLTGKEPRVHLEKEGYITVQDELRGEHVHLTSKSRKLLSDLREGGDPPEAKRGDPNESVAHIKGVERIATALESLIDDPEIPIDRVVRYWSPPAKGTRLDVVGLDSNGNPEVCVEVERPTNDLKKGVLEDADAMAACDPTLSLWVVVNRQLGHQIVGHLASPQYGAPRISLDPADVAAPTTPLDRYDLSSPACGGFITYNKIDSETVRELISDAIESSSN